MPSSSRRESRKGQGPGRPAKAESEVKSHHLNLNLDEQQVDIIRRAAAADDDRPHNWVRRMVLRLARERLGLPTPGLDGDAKKPG